MGSLTGKVRPVRKTLARFQSPEEDYGVSDETARAFLDYMEEVFQSPEEDYGVSDLKHYLLKLNFNKCFNPPKRIMGSLTKKSEPDTQLKCSVSIPRRGLWGL